MRRHNMMGFTGFVAALAMIITVPSARALTIVDNLGSPNANGFYTIYQRPSTDPRRSGTETSVVAQGFTMDDGADRELSSITLALRSNVGATGSFQVDIYTGTSSGPGSLYFSLGAHALSSVSGTTAQSVEFTSGTPVTLSAGATYWVVVSADSADYFLYWQAASSGASTGVGTMLNAMRSTSAGTWNGGSNDHALLKVEAVPEPSTWALIGLGTAAVLLAGRRHRITA